MSCCCASVGDAVQRQFGVKKATKELARYRAKGPEPTTRLLIAGLTKVGPLHGRLLDVGSGIGALTFELCVDRIVRKRWFAGELLHPVRSARRQVVP